MIAKVIKTEDWSTYKIILIVIILLLPFGPLAVAAYFGIKELLRRRKEKRCDIREQRKRTEND
jgi:hypothetical protein